MRFAKFLGVAVLGLALTGCTTMRIEKLEEMEPYGSDFTRSLAERYREFVVYKVDDATDIRDAHYFATKGVSTARGKVLAPEELQNWNIPADARNELMASRARLINAYKLDSREIVPDLSAHAQANFDCWVEALDEGGPQDRIQSCRAAFMDAMTRIEQALAKQPEPQPVPTPVMEEPVKEAAPAPAEPEKYVVFFAYDSSKIDADGLALIGQVAEEIRGADVVSIKLSGHADTKGTNRYNDRLSNKRAKAVKAVLVNNGVESNIIDIESYGETKLLVDTGDEVEEAKNRRVEIIIMNPEFNLSQGMPELPALN